MVRNLLHTHTFEKLMCICVASQSLYTNAGLRSHWKGVGGMQRRNRRPPKTLKSSSHPRVNATDNSHVRLGDSSWSQETGKGTEPCDPTFTGSSCEETLLDVGAIGRKSQLPESMVDVLCHICTVVTTTPPFRQWSLVGETSA